MIKTLITAILIVVTAIPFAFAGAIEVLEARGIDRGAIEKARVLIYENPQYKGLGAAVYYCDLMKTRKDLEKTIVITKRIKGKSGSPSYSSIERLDDSYATNTMEIKEQQKLYKAAFNKILKPRVCTNQKGLSAQMDNLHDQLLMQAFVK